MIKQALVKTLAIVLMSAMPMAAAEHNSAGIGVKAGKFAKIVDKNADATAKVDGKEVEYCLWYNPDKWELLEENLNDVAEYSFKLNDGDAFAMMIPETEIVPLEEAPYIIVEGAKYSGVEEINIEKMENRLVNGSDVLYLVWSGKVMETDFTYMYNIYSGPKGTVQVVTYTLDYFLDENKDDMNDFLNGFCMQKIQ